MVIAGFGANSLGSRPSKANFFYLNLNSSPHVAFINKGGLVSFRSVQGRAAAYQHVYRMCGLVSNFRTEHRGSFFAVFLKAVYICALTTTNSVGSQRRPRPSVVPRSSSRIFVARVSMFDQRQVVFKLTLLNSFPCERSRRTRPRRTERPRAAQLTCHRAKTALLVRRAIIVRLLAMALQAIKAAKRFAALVAVVLAQPGHGQVQLVDVLDVLLQAAFRCGPPTTMGTGQVRRIRHF